MMRRRAGLWGFALFAAACGDGVGFLAVGEPEAPQNLDARYFAGAVVVSWELGPAWDGESFRVYAKRVSDPDFFLIAEVTSCSDGLCSYSDTNIVPQVSYEYFVAAVDVVTGDETASAFSIRIDVPRFDAPPVPGALEAVALDGANYLRWDDRARDAEDFSFYRVYLEQEDGSGFLIGETDSEGFLDELAENGLTYAYFVSSVDQFGHESDGGAVAEGTPRPDFHNEAVWNHLERPDVSGFRFQVDETTDPILAGDDPSRHFRLEVDAQGWWLVAGPGTEFFPLGFETTALKCGPGADAVCVSLEVAPTEGFTADDLSVNPQTTYVLRVRGDGGGLHYAVIRVTIQGFDQNDDAIMIFDWAFQLQVGVPNLAPIQRVPAGRSE